VDSYPGQLSLASTTVYVPEGVEGKVFLEVWPGGVQRSSRGTCRTDRAELYPLFNLSVDAPPPVPQYYRQGNPMEGESRWET
jgi:hypothetical protein